MKVTICDDEVSAIDDTGRIFKINGVLVKKSFPKVDAFYGVDDSFSKFILIKGMSHDAVELTEGLINIL